MAQDIPTQVGDVLILGTTKSFCIHVVGQIAKDGQQDLWGQSDLKYERDRHAAFAVAKALCASGRRMFLLDVDTDTWSEISDAGD